MAKSVDSLIASLLARPIAFQVVFARVAGGAANGVFLSQLWHWHDKGWDTDGWIYKTQDDWEDETCLTRYEQESARKALRAKGLLEEKRQGLPAKLYYRLNQSALFDAIKALPEKSPSEIRRERQQEWGKTPSLSASQPRVGQNPILEAVDPPLNGVDSPHSTTENTSKTTTKNTGKGGRERAKPAPPPDPAPLSPLPTPEFTPLIEEVLDGVEQILGCPMHASVRRASSLDASALLSRFCTAEILAGFRQGKRIKDAQKSAIPYRLKFLVQDLPFWIKDIRERLVCAPGTLEMVSRPETSALANYLDESGERYKRFMAQAGSPFEALTPPPEEKESNTP